ncbi:DegQ family serine endoprotease [Kiloniella sp. b19]|uniref:DegQ family serine endoprotease n=1 Tax=Kiloniella sp. GXU_MW_B19 TaxID=3141326 RepID=UPI0031D4F521
MNSVKTTHARVLAQSKPAPKSMLVFGLFLSVLMALNINLAQARSAPESFADLAEELLPSVVNIIALQEAPDEEPQAQVPQGENFEEFFRDFFERRGQRPPEQRRGNAQGSGFIIDSDGFIVTNHHVIDGADAVSVRMQDGTELEAEVIGSDERTDLALLKVKSSASLPAVEFGDSDDARIGDWVIAIGNPFGLGGSVSAGIISARARDIRSGPYDDFIQTDAAINRGNSGGPLFNMEGEVVGVNTAIFSPSGGSVGIGFSIPSNLVENIVAQLRENGEVRRGWLGVRIQTVTEELAEGLRLDEAAGALVSEVNPNGPAGKGGIQQGDVILKFDGRRVPEMRKLPRMVAETAIGKEVKVEVWRKGKSKTLTVVLGELEDEVAAAAAPQEPEPPKGNTPTEVIGEIGISLATLNNELRERYSFSQDQEGVVVTSIDPAGTAAEKNIQEGDLIIEVDQEKVSAPGDVEDLIAKAKDAGYRVVTLLVNRQGQHTWVAVKLKD